MTFDRSPQSAGIKGMMRNRAQLAPWGVKVGGAVRWCFAVL